MRLDEIWGRAALGIKLTEAHETGYWVTADSAAASLRVSDDTARRWLESLVRDAKVWVEIGKWGRRYRPVEEFALLTIEVLRAAERFHPQLAAE